MGLGCFVAGTVGESSSDEKLFSARGTIKKLREGVLLSPKLLNFGTRYQKN